MNMPSLINFSAGVILGLALPGLLSLNLFKRRKKKPLIKTTLTGLARLNDEIFACFLQPSYPDNRYLFERRIHLQKKIVMQSMIELQQVSQEDAHQLVVQKLNQLFDLMLACAQLRWRVTDHTVFLLCTDELTDLAMCISHILDDTARHYSVKDPAIRFHVDALPDYIMRLEDNYHQILQVSAKEPINFLLFIANLKLFCDELSSDD